MKLHLKRMNILVVKISFPINVKFSVKVRFKKVRILKMQKIILKLLLLSMPTYVLNVKWIGLLDSVWRVCLKFPHCSTYNKSIRWDFWWDGEWEEWVICRTCKILSRPSQTTKGHLTDFAPMCSTHRHTHILKHPPNQDLHPRFAVFFVFNSFLFLRQICRGILSNPLYVV